MRPTWLTAATLSLALLLLGCNSNSRSDGNTNPPPEDDTQEPPTEEVVLPEPIYSPEPDEAVIYYKRNDHFDDQGNVNVAAYSGWGLHLWDDDDRVEVKHELVITTDWSSPLYGSAIDPNYGAVFVVPMNSAQWKDFMFIVHKGDEKDIGGRDWLYDRATLGDRLFLFEGVDHLYTEPLLEPPVARTGAAAHWLDQTHWVYSPRSPNNSIKVWRSSNAELALDAAEKSVTGGQADALLPADVPDSTLQRFPHLSSWQGWTLNLSESEARNWLKQQLWLAEYDAEGDLINVTAVQTAGALDDVYADTATPLEYGAIIQGGDTHFRVWAPTAQSVKLVVHPDQTETLHNMALDELSGAWSVSVPEALHNAYYLYEVSLYHPESEAIETLRVTDPYSLSLAMNSRYSQVVDLDDAALKPVGWDSSDTLPALSYQDISIYEMHVRDFSISDTLGNPDHSGKYLAFTNNERESVQHLLSLRDRGLTHAHLMPVFDIATINEDPNQRVDIDQPFSDLCAAVAAVATQYSDDCASGKTVAEVMDSLLPEAQGGEVQALNAHVRDLDAFNWGYDPWHFNVPEGSYATDAEGSQRILEFRTMVQALHEMELRVVMDVVYNHTNASGLHPKSVFDKLVPGYYHRRDPISGAVETSTCCDNTASEHRMFEKFMVDSLIIWARDYRIDAFRFDLMGHHMKTNMELALEEVLKVRPHVYFYGEGWDYGEVGQNQRGVNASQTNLPGTGISTFTDRLRDGVRGGGPFDSGESLRQNQGFGNAAVANELNQADPSAFHATQLGLKDIVRLGLAGNLKQYQFIGHDGSSVTGGQVDYNGSPAGYADSPLDVVNYVSKHDNQTLWDNNQYKLASSISASDRARLQALALSIPAFSQGIPFFHMGSELLRSKSMSRDSYDSGDWFNAVAFDQSDNNWNVGLPRQNVDGDNWSVIEPILNDPEAQPSTQDIALTAEQFGDWLEIRYSSPLFRLTSADQVQDVVSFHNTGPDQVRGVIMMQLTDTAANLDPNHDALMVIFNTTTEEQTLNLNHATGFTLHPVLVDSADLRVQGAAFSGGEFSVPALTTAVFVK